MKIIFLTKCDVCTVCHVSNCFYVRNWFSKNHIFCQFSKMLCVLISCMKLESRPPRRCFWNYTRSLSKQTSINTPHALTKNASFAVLYFALHYSSFVSSLAQYRWYQFLLQDAVNLDNRKRRLCWFIGTLNHVARHSKNKMSYLRLTFILI
jgi:hypothetical protein